jgi:uncharacterized membrane protein YraQ (UPF0718 family)
MTVETILITFNYFLYLTFELILLFVGITFVVGMILQYVKPSTIKKVLSNKHRGMGNILGAGLGALTPFCSCSTIPILVGLLNSGVPFGASMSFLIASPVLNPIIIGLLLSLFGWKMTGLYVIITFGAAVLSGILWEKIGLAKEVKKVKIIGGQEAATMIPISAVLLEKGMSIGAIVALIIGGAGASIPEVTLLGSIFKRKLVIAFVVTVFSIAVMAGFLFTALTAWLW